MLIKKFTDRMYARELYENIWLQAHGNYLVPDKKIAKNSLKNLSSFHTTSKLHKATLAFIVNQVMSSDEISVLRDTFVALDKNGDGFLSPDELKEAMGKFTGDVANNAEELLKRVDEDGNGCINYSEFLIAATNWEKELSRERLHMAFKEFDKDGNGSISVQELSQALGGTKGQANIFLEMVKEADADGNGEIDLEEFCNFMEKVKEKNRV